MVSSSFKILKNPIVVIMSVVLGLFIGIAYGDVAAAIAPFGEMYLYLLQMSVLPILISAIVSSVAKLVKSQVVKKFTSKLLIVLFLLLSISALMGIFVGIVGEPGNVLNETNKNVLGAFIESSEDTTDLEISLSKNYEELESESFLDFIADIIPQNIFQSLTSGRAMELVFFSIILGVAIGLLKDINGEIIINIFTALFLAFQKIINWAMYLLPIGLICLVSNQVRDAGPEIIIAMLYFISLFYLIGVVIIVANTMVIRYRSKASFVKVILATLEPMIIAFSTRSSFATIPSCVDALEKRLFFERASTNLLIPLGITLGRFGNIIYFSLAAVFLSQLYNVSFGPKEFLITFVASIFAGIATAGATGFATLAMISIVLSPLGLPYEVIIIILLAIDVIVDPMRTLLIVHVNLAMTALVSKNFTGKRAEVTEDSDIKIQEGASVYGSKQKKVFGP